MTEIKYPARPGTIQPKKQRPQCWKHGPDPRTHFMHRIYVQKKAQASHRKEIFNFEFDEWKAMWDEKFDLRGRKSDDYCMTRTDPNGPWDEYNTFIATRHDIYQHISSVAKHREIVTPTGVFQSVSDCARKYNVSQYQVRKWMKDMPTKYYKASK